MRRFSRAKCCDARRETRRRSSRSRSRQDHRRRGGWRRRVAFSQTLFPYRGLLCCPLLLRLLFPGVFELFEGRKTTATRGKTRDISTSSRPSANRGAAPFYEIQPRSHCALDRAMIFYVLVFIICPFLLLSFPSWLGPGELHFGGKTVLMERWPPRLYIYIDVPAPGATVTRGGPTSQADVEVFTIFARTWKLSIHPYR